MGQLGVGCSMCRSVIGLQGCAWKGMGIYSRLLGFESGNCNQLRKMYRISLLSFLYVGILCL